MIDHRRWCSEFQEDYNPTLPMSMPRRQSQDQFHGPRRLLLRLGHGRSPSPLRARGTRPTTTPKAGATSFSKLSSEGFSSSTLSSSNTFLLSSSPSSSSSTLPTDLLDKMSTMIHSVKVAQKLSIQHQRQHQQQQQEEERRRRRRRRRSTLSSTTHYQTLQMLQQQQMDDQEGYSSSFAQLQPPPPTNMISFHSLDSIRSSSGSNPARGHRSPRGSYIYDDDEYFDYYDDDCDFVSSSASLPRPPPPPLRRSTVTTTTRSSSISTTSTTTSTTLPHDIHDRIEYVMNSIRMAKQERRYK